jgi:hypothetical protein
MAELRKRYSPDRVAAGGEYLTLLFFGKDIRLLKARAAEPKGRNAWFWKSIMSENWISHGE